MDAYFIITVALALILAFGVGCAMGFKAKRRVSTNDVMGCSGYLALSMVSRSALQKLDSGDSVGAKQDLCNAVANFYHSFKSSDREPVLSERRQIETLSQSSAVLADALRKREDPDEKPVA